MCPATAHVVALLQMAIGEEVIATDVDTHFTLFYVCKRAMPDLEQILENLDRELSNQIGKPHLWRGRLKLNAEYAQPNYAWGDVLVASQVHSTLHALVAAGLRNIPRGRHVWSKTVVGESKVISRDCC